MDHLLNTQYYSLIRARHGLFLSNPKDVYIGRALIEYGEYCEQEWAAVSQMVQPGAVVIEAGANIGAFTVPLAKQVGPAGRIYAIEPQPLTFQLLNANLALNDLTNVQSFHAACGSEATTLKLQQPRPDLEANFGGYSLDMLASDDSPVQVAVHRLDQLLDLPRLDMIKADIEGMEVEMLRGASGLIERFRPILFLEANKDHRAGLITYLAEIGYEAWWHISALFNPNNFAGKTENTIGPFVSHNIFCLPAEKGIPVKGLRKVEGPDDDL